MIVSLIGLVSMFLGCAEPTAPTEYLKSAKAYRDQGNLKAAVIESKNALRENPDNVEARWLLGLIYIDMKNGAAAEKELVKAKELGVIAESITVPLGQALLLQGKYRRVIDTVSPSSSTSPRQMAVISRIRGDAMRSLGMQEEGCELYRNSIATDASEVEAYWGLANCAYTKDDLSEARTMIDTALSIDGNNAETWLILGDFERLSGNPQAAIDAYSSALKHDPDKVDALFQRAMLYIVSGRLVEARADVDRIKKLPGGGAVAQFVTAQLHYVDGENDQALDTVRELMNSQPDYLPALLLLGQIQYDRKDYEQVVRALSQYLQKAPGNLGARKLLAATYIKLRSYDGALELLKPYIDTGKADAQVLALAGEVYLRTDEAQVAEALFESASELIPSSAFLQTRLGLSRLTAGKEEEAERELEASSALDSKDYRADLSLAYYYLGKKQFDQALAAIAVLEEKLPESPGTFNLKGLAYMGKKDFAQARRNFETALTLEPTLVSAAVRLASLDLQENNIPAARTRYQSILKNDGKNIAAMVGLAELAALEKNDVEYFDWLDRAVKARPSSLVPRVMMVNYYLRKGEQQKALVVARDIVDARPDSPRALALLGQAQLAAGEKENAVVTYSRLTKMIPKSAPAQYRLARAYAAKGNERETREALRKTLELDPRYLDAMTALAALETRTGGHEEALRLAREVQEVEPVSAMGLVLEGDAWTAGKDYTQAVRAYEQAFDKEKSSGLLVKLQHALMRSGDERKADDTLLDWLKGHPGDVAVRAYLAQSYTQRGLNRQAIDQYEILLSASPNSPIVLNNLAVLYREEKDPRALTVAEKVYGLQPDNPEFADTLGWILAQEGQAGRGLELLQKAVAAKPDDSEMRFHLAYTLAETGETSQARQEIEQLQQQQLPPELQRKVSELLDRLP